MPLYVTTYVRIAHRSGVTVATSSLLRVDPYANTNTVIAGLSTTFHLGATNALEREAIVKEITALHVYVGHSGPLQPLAGWPSISTQIAGLRRLLLGGESTHTETGRWFQQAATVNFPQSCQLYRLKYAIIGQNTACG